MSLCRNPKNNKNKNKNKNKNIQEVYNGEIQTPTVQRDTIRQITREAFGAPSSK
eukprot:SAG11_NODE_30042_length_304_cov_6.073171_1_plen_53_part_10